jgi:hypothetical protein
MLKVALNTINQPNQSIMKRYIKTFHGVHQIEKILSVVFNKSNIIQVLVVSYKNLGSVPWRFKPHDLDNL